MLFDWWSVHITIQFCMVFNLHSGSLYGRGGDVSNDAMTLMWHQLWLCPLPPFLSLSALAIKLCSELAALAGLSASEWSVISKHYVITEPTEAQGGALTLHWHYRALIDAPVVTKWRISSTPLLRPWTLKPFIICPWNLHAYISDQSTRIHIRNATLFSFFLTQATFHSQTSVSGSHKGHWGASRLHQRKKSFDLLCPEHQVPPK